ncbi:peptidase, partial [Streptomyces albiflaviniger]|nr:peptidase [Streptomyces albiflaviniger]
MRLPTALSLRAVLPAAALAFAPALYGVPAYAAEAEPAACGDRNASDFPIEAHLRDGPDQYALGGGWRGWHLELRNATDTGCRAIHPIAVLVDQARQLRPRHIGFEFLDPAADGGATWRTVSFQTTDEDENIGVFEDHFKGFTVPAHKTVDVQVRTRFTADAPEGPVTANAIAVQRRADDGDWVGQSNDYVFRVGGAAAATGSGTDAGTAGTDTGTGTVAGTKGPDAGTRTRAATRSG